MDASNNLVETGADLHQGERRVSAMKSLVSPERGRDMEGACMSGGVRQGACVSGGMCVAGGVHVGGCGKGACMAEVGSARQRGMCGKEACMAWGMCGRGHAW